MPLPDQSDWVDAAYPVEELIQRKRALLRVCNNCQQADPQGPCPDDKTGIHIFAVPKFVEASEGA